MNHDINRCAIPHQDAGTSRQGGLRPMPAPAPASALAPTPATTSARLALDEHFHWHRIRRMPRK